MRTAKLITAILALTTMFCVPAFALTVKCYSCDGPALSDKCSFNGREGTWGPDEVIDGVVYHVCNIPTISVIRNDDAFLTSAQVKAHAMSIARSRRGTPTPVPVPRNNQKK